MLDRSLDKGMIVDEIRKTWLLIGAAGLMAVFATADCAFAHSGGGDFSIVSGALHPLKGLDHMLAMLAVGIWGAQLGLPAVWVLPVIFPLVMAVGGVLGILGVPLPAVEVSICASVVGMGVLVALRYSAPLCAAVAVCGLFAVFHGYAHGVELPQGADAIVYCLGFVLSTGAVHLAGVGLGLMERIPRGRVLLRLCGAVIAVAGTSMFYDIVKVVTG
jgi:urease accessory protein